MKGLIVGFIITGLFVLSACAGPTITPKPSEVPSPTPTTEETLSPPSEEEPIPSPTPDPTPAGTTTPTIPNDDLKVHFIDVGQGDSILIDFGDTEILIDGGGKSPGVVTYLNDYVDGALEVIIATHPHADHIGGLIAVLSEFEVEEIWHNGDSSTSNTYAEFMNGVESEGAEVHIARLHDVIQVSELSLYVHHPSGIFDSTNNNSIVLHLTYGNTDFLFTGDAERDAEGAMMVLSSVRIPDVEILKVGHHGSRTASSQDFLAITSPEVAIYMAKEGNSYGHPHEETIQALNEIGTKIYGTDIHGTIVVTTDGETYTLQLARQVEPLSVTIPSPSPPTLTPTPTPPSTESIPSTYLPEVPRISVEEVKAKLDAGSNIVIVDSRSNTSYEQSHITGAVSLPLADMAEPYDDLDGYDEVMTYCT